jgi:hypothetical protein
MGAFDGGPAGAADLKPVIAAPVEKDKALLSRIAPLFDPLQKLFGKMGEPAAFVHGLFHVDDGDFGKRGEACAARDLVEAVFADISVVARFDRGSGASKENYCIFQMSTHDGDVASMVEGGLFALFIGAVVLFIDDDEA